MEPILYRIDVEDSSGGVIGDGPITSIVSWTSTTKIDEAGTFTLSVPAADGKSSLLTHGATIFLRAFLGGVRTDFGAGVIERRRVSHGIDGRAILEVSGSDTLRELSRRSVGFLALESNGEPITHAAAVDAIANYAPASWTFVADDSPDVANVYGGFAGESVLAAVRRLAQLSGSHMVRTGAREITFRAHFTDSGVTALAPGDSGDLPDDVIAIRSIEIIEESFDRVSRV